VSISPRPGWRCFPWDPSASEDEPFSPSFLNPYQGHGRFDLPGERRGVLYVAEDPVHAIAERIQDLRNQNLEPEDLSEGGHRYALAEVTVGEAAFGKVADLCEPAEIRALEAPPDRVVAHARRTTQGIARRLHDDGFTGLRWWSVFWGEWHSLVWFRDRLPREPEFGRPAVVDFDHVALREAARRLGIRLKSSRRR